MRWSAIWISVDPLKDWPSRTQGPPPFSVTEKVEFDSNTSQIRFPISTEEKARAGLTKNLFCFVKVPLSGQLVTHSVGQGGQIRLDNPPPKPKVVSSKPKASTPKPVVKKDKPLSRLEQLRLAAQRDQLTLS